MNIFERVLMYAVFNVIIPAVVLNVAYPGVNPFPFLVLLAAAVGIITFIEHRAFDRQYNHLLEDAEAFGKVVRQLWQDDSLMATALWKKVHPNCPPPWHRPPEEE